MAVEQIVLHGQAEDHESEFAALGKHPGEHERAVNADPRQPTDGEQDKALDGQQAEQDRGDQQRFAGGEADVCAHAYADEEQAKQESLERIDAGFDFVAVFGIGEEDASEEGAQRHRDATHLHKPGGAEHDQQGACGEHFGDLRARGDAKQRAHQQATADYDHGDGQHHAKEAEKIGCRAGAGRGNGRQRHEGEDRDRGDILEQQDGEGEAAMRALQFLALGEDLQADRGRRQRQREANDEGDFPAKPECHADGTDGQRAGQHLDAAEAEHLTTHDPESLWRQLESDDEQHEDHAELGDVRDLLGVADQVQ